MDTAVFLVEKLVSTAPVNRVIAGLSCSRPSLVAYLIAASRASLRQPVFVPHDAPVNDLWSRRTLRLKASEALVSKDYEAVKELSLAAAQDESFAPYRSEYLLSAAVAAFHLLQYTNAIEMLNETMAVWRSSWLAMRLEPKVGNLVNYFMWACFSELGLKKEGLHYLHSAATTEWTRIERCERWMELIHEAYEVSDEQYLRIGLRGATRHCPAKDPKLRRWIEILQGQ